MNPDCPHCTAKSQAVYGTVTLNNGITINWLQFVDASLLEEAAKKEAARIVAAQHGRAVAKCTAN